MTQGVETLLAAAAAPCLAAFADVLAAVVGVILGLGGAGLLLMGLIAVTDREWRHGGLAALFGAALVAAGLWLVGAFG